MSIYDEIYKFGTAMSAYNIESVELYLDDSSFRRLQYECERFMKNGGNAQPIRSIRIQANNTTINVGTDYA